MYAVVRTGGKQYRVQEGHSLRVDRLPGELGETIELRDVLLLADGDNVTVGNPLIEGARVVGTIAEQGRGKKVIVFRFKAKTRARKKTGQRHAFTRFRVEDILAPGQEPKPKAVAAAPVEEAAVEAAPKHGRRTKAVAAEDVDTAPAETAMAEETAMADLDALASDTETVTTADAAPAADAPSDEKPKRRSRKKEE